VWDPSERRLREAAPSRGILTTKEFDAWRTACEQRDISPDDGPALLMLERGVAAKRSSQSADRRAREMELVRRPRDQAGSLGHWSGWLALLDEHAL
jgi:hypothetical protein